LERIVDDVSFVGRGQVVRARNDTLSAWQSQYTGRFSESVNATQNKIDKCAQQIRNASRQLRAAAEEVRRAEREIAKIK